MSINKDHCKAVEDIMKAGIDCYMSPGTKKALINEGYIEDNHRLITQKTYKPFKINNWIIKAFEVEHDAAEPWGFFIWSKNTGDKLVYITDSFYSKFKFKNVNYYMIECNYSIDILNQNVKNGRIPVVQKNRIIKTHFGLENVKDFLKANDLSKVNEIWLLHLSNRNSNAEQFKREIQELTGKLVKVAGGGD
jgi:phosphoribosyl 1,2-cyclic phosphodiesterase